MKDECNGLTSANLTGVQAEEPPGDGPLLSVILEAYLAEIESGERPDRSELFRRHPELADQLRECLEGLDWIQGAALELPGANPDEGEPPPQALGDFRIVRELGRGGMGVVYEAEQLSIGRRVALKVLPFAAMLDKQQLARFKNEARAAGTLEHPNIVAIHSVGVERGVHYYAMHLVEGESLAQVIARLRRERGIQNSEVGMRDGDADATIYHPSAIRAPESAPDTNPVAALSTLPDFNSREYYRAIARLGIQAAEALDHAHQCGILHRDIKPANVLVDDLGKLWITDFGLARIEADSGMTMSGDILGTLRYMSPEQALAKRVVVDHRSDIYSLGVTLYELATLRPAFPGDDRHEVLRQIAFEEPPRPRSLIARIPEDLETIVLKAMEKNAAERYATAEELADDLRRFSEDRPIIARKPQFVAMVRRWSRRHRSAVWTAAITILASTIVLAASIGWVARDRAARLTVAEGAATVALDEASRLIAKDKWSEAMLAVKRAEVVLEGEQTSQLAHRAQELRKDVEMALVIEEIRFSSPYEIHERWPKYAQAFRDFGIDFELMEPGEAAGLIRERPIRLELVMALDNWASALSGADKSSWKPLTAVARIADPNPWRNRLRDTFGLKGKEREAALIALATSPESLRLAPPSAVLLAMQLGKDLVGRAEAPLRSTQGRYPSNLYVNFWLGYCLHELNPPQTDESIRFLTATLAVRADAMTYENLGLAFSEKGLWNEAADNFRRAIRLKPGQADVHYALGRVFFQSQRWDEAIDSFKEAVRLAPSVAEFHSDLGTAFGAKGLWDQAIASYREALRLNPDHAMVHRNLGAYFERTGMVDDAIASYREAIRSQPDYAEAHRDLGATLFATGHIDEAVGSLQEAVRLSPKVATFQCDLGVMLGQKELLDEAIQCYREAINLAPDYSRAHGNLGGLLRRKGLLDEAIASCREAIRLEPDFGKAHYNLGAAHFAKGQFDESVVSFKEAVRLSPAEASCHLMLGRAYYLTHVTKDAIASWQETIRLLPEDPEAHSYLGMALSGQGAFDDAIKHYQEALRIDPHKVNAQNNLAWLFATAPDDNVRDGPRAVELATKACESSNFEDAGFISTLAAAYAEIDDFATAVKWVNKSLELAEDEELRSICRQQLTSFEAGRPWREAKAKSP